MTSMIPNLASPSICVIDDEEDDYGPILDALIALGLGCVHVRGKSGDPLPPKPFDSLRLVFVDLHLSGQIGKLAASHTANVVRKVISAERGPILVVIWSKYEGDLAGDPSLPPEDQPTEADLFRKELLACDVRFKARLAFVTMPKPKLADRPAAEAWIKVLEYQITDILKTLGPFEILWTWESLARDAGVAVSDMLIQVAESSPGDDKPATKLQGLLRLIAHQQGGPDIGAGTALRHLLTVLSQIGLDVLEAGAADARLESHLAWLSEKVDDTVRQNHSSAKLNAVLLTSSVGPSSAPFIPGTVFDISDHEAFAAATGLSIEKLQRDCFAGGAGSQELTNAAALIAVEITAPCDFHQGHRQCATLVAGFVYPGRFRRKVNSKDACKATPVFSDRYVPGEPEVGLVLCSRYRFTIQSEEHPPWLRPRLRLREVIATEIRNWHSSQLSRIGYLSF